MISVIIPTANREPFLRDALESLVNQTFNEFEVIVINDGGCPLRMLLRDWRQKLRLRLIELPTRRGISNARNLGVRQAISSYIAFLDDDDIFLPRHLEVAYNALMTSAADFVYLGALVSDRRLGSLPADTSGMPKKNYPFNERFLLVTNYIHTGSVVARNFNKTSARFDISLSYCEDWDLWITLTRQAGFRIAFINELTSIYHQVPGTPGLIAEAQRINPCPLSAIRDRLYEKWISDDPKVNEYRHWFRAFESFRNTRIAKNLELPPTCMTEFLIGYTDHSAMVKLQIFRLFQASSKSNRATSLGNIPNGMG